MKRFLLALSLLAPATAGSAPQFMLLLKEEQVTIEYDVTAGEAVVRMEAEIEQLLRRIDVRGPLGAGMVRLDTSTGRSMDFSGFLVESSEVSLEELLATYPVGRYQMLGRTRGGQPVSGGAFLSHSLLPAPEILVPAEDAVNVSTDGLIVAWVPDSQATGYQVVLEQNDNDGLVVNLPGTSGAFRVPAGVLLRDTETLLEISVKAPSGNRTLVERQFRTAR